jgi:uncharacterized protein YggT (Ycf19 family)
METEKLAAEEARRITQHERIKEQLEEDVHGHIAEKASSRSAAEEAELESVAKGLKHSAAAEVVETEAELQRARRLARASQVVDYVFFLVYSLAGLEIGLELVGARQFSPFKRFLDHVSAPFLGPFRGLMPDPAVGSFQLMLSYVVALLVYALLHSALRRLLRLFAHRQARI